MITDYDIADKILDIDYNEGGADGEQKVSLHAAIEAVKEYIFQYEPGAVTCRLKMTHMAGEDNEDSQKEWPKAVIDFCEISQIMENPKWKRIVDGKAVSTTILWKIGEAGAYQTNIVYDELEKRYMKWKRQQPFQ